MAKSQGISDRISWVNPHYQRTKYIRKRVDQLVHLSSTWACRSRKRSIAAAVLFAEIAEFAALRPFAASVAQNVVIEYIGDIFKDMRLFSNKYSVNIADSSGDDRRIYSNYWRQLGNLIKKRVKIHDFPSF